MRKLKRTVAVALSGAAMTAGMAAVTAPAQAATTPSGACNEGPESGYYQIDQHALGTAATIYLFYNGSRNCVVTWVNNPTGTKKYDLKAWVERQKDLVEDVDYGFYYYYAGPVKITAPGQCISWGGAYGSTQWASPWEHCG